MVHSAMRLCVDVCRRHAYQTDGDSFDSVVNSLDVQFLQERRVHVAESVAG